MKPFNTDDLVKEIQKFTLELGKFVIENNPDRHVLMNSFYVVATIAALDSGYSKEDLLKFLSDNIDIIVNEKKEKHDQLEKEKA